MTDFPMLTQLLPPDHLDRLFGRDLRADGWEIDLPIAANDDIDHGKRLDAMLLLSLAKRGNR